MGTELGERIRWFRERAQESQERLAAAIGATGSAVSRWERAEVDPQLNFILKMCEHWGISPSELLTPTGAVQADSSEAFKRFEASEYGEIAQRRGWLPALRAMRFPVEPTTQLYCDIVHALITEAQRRSGQP